MNTKQPYSNKFRESPKYFLLPRLKIYHFAYLNTFKYIENKKTNKFLATLHEIKKKKKTCKIYLL